MLVALYTVVANTVAVGAVVDKIWRAIEPCLLDWASEIISLETISLVAGRFYAWKST